MNRNFTSRTDFTQPKRKGISAPLIAALMVPLLGMVAFAVDYGYLTVVRADLQRAADASVLAAVLDLIPSPSGVQDEAAVRARVREYVNKNLNTGSSFSVPDGDIVIGRYDPTTVNSGNLVLFNTGIKDTVKVTLKRDGSVNNSVGLFFARVLGLDSQNVTVTATAVLRKGIAARAEADILPFALPESFWDSLNPGDDLRIFNDNKIEDGFGNQVTVIDNLGQSVPGNWGTVDIGYENNSTHDLEGQIINGLRQDDVNELYAENRINTNQHVAAPLNVQAETGLSAGMKDSVRAIHGQTRIIPIYDTVNGEFGGTGGGGNTAEFHVVKWGVIRVIDSRWNGNKNTYINAERAYTYDAALVAREDLSDGSTPSIEGAFTSPVLVR